MTRPGKVAVFGMMITFLLGTVWNQMNSSGNFFASYQLPPTFEIHAQPSSGGSSNSAIAATDSSSNTATSSSLTMDDIHNYILGPDDYGRPVEQCGHPRARKDCPQWYSIAAIQQSAAIQDPVLLAEYAQRLASARSKSQAKCDKQNSQVVTDSGGWCLNRQNRARAPKVTFRAENITYPMAINHVPASKRVVSELINLIQTEHVTSMNDFGAGIAQYKAAVTNQIQDPNFSYRAYDGAGNGEEYTSGMMKYFDLTLPLDLPVADWVMSLEVGEHVPSKFEGMLIRNLHRHNRKGIILSWAIVGQDGHSHINNHSNEYLIRVFEALGYTYDVEFSNRLRVPKDNYKWFENSLMVFRRNSSTTPDSSSNV